MIVKLDIHEKSRGILFHEELDEAKILESFELYLKSIGRLKDGDKVDIRIDEIIIR